MCGLLGAYRITAVLVLTTRNMAAERRCAAALDRTHDFELAEAHMAGIGLRNPRTHFQFRAGFMESVV